MTTKKKTTKKATTTPKTPKAPREPRTKTLRANGVYISDMAYFLAVGHLPRGRADFHFAAVGGSDVFSFTGEWGKAKQAAKAYFAGLNVRAAEVAVPASTN